jgi:DegV family protein with EDD domain
MSYRIIVDSCGELTEEMKQSGNFQNIPLSISLGDWHIVDDETFDQAQFLEKVAQSPECPKTSCPSPDKYMESYCCEAERIYVVTLSSQLSGSYNSAVVGKNLYEEEYGEKQIYVFDSRSASIGETLIALKIEECEQAGMPFEQVIEQVEKYIEGQTTYFTLESLETMKKNGRLTGVKSLVATALHIKPVMGSTPEGTIAMRCQARGINKALAKMVDLFVKELACPEEKTVAISHCNCLERALSVKRAIEEQIHVKKIIVLDTNGISSTYASDGGIIVVG